MGLRRYRERRAVKADLRRLRARLVALSTERGTVYYWRDGAIRSATLRPTKGWKTSRVEAFEIKSVAGDLMIADIDVLMKEI